MNIEHFLEACHIRKDTCCPCTNPVGSITSFVALLRWYLSMDEVFDVAISMRSSHMTLAIVDLCKLCYHCCVLGRLGL